MKAVYDTNVYVSSLFWDGPPRKLVLKAARGEVDLVVSDFILDEVARVLTDSFDVPNERAEEVAQNILRISKRVRPKHRLDVVRDKQDNRILECAVEGGCSYIVTGDRDLLALKKYKNIGMVSPQEFLEIFNY